MESGKPGKDMMEEETINIKDYVQILLRRKYTILLIFIVCLPFIFLKASSCVPIYRASGKLLIQENNAPPLLTGAGYKYDPGFLATQMQLIKSAKVGEMVVRDLNLDETYQKYFPTQKPDSSIIRDFKTWMGNLYTTALKMAGLAGNQPISQQSQKNPLSEAEIKDHKIKSMASMISSGLFVSVSSEEGNIVEVGFMSPNPVFAQKIVNNVASAYKRALLEMRTQSTSETLEWMKQKADLQREKLEISEKVLQEYKKKNDIYTVGNVEALFPGKISDLSKKLTYAQTEVKELESLYQEISRISTQEALNLPVVLGNDVVRGLRQKIIDQEQALEGLSKKIGFKHPQMIRAQKDLVAIKATLEEEIQKVIQSVKNKYELGKGQISSLQQLLDQAKQGAASMSDKLIQYEILNRDVEVNRLLYDRLISRIKESDVSENKRTIDVWVVEEARRPLAPTNQGPKRTILLGLIASLMAGVGLAFFLEFLDDTVKTAEDAEAKLGIPVLGMIPFFKDKSHPIEKIVYHLPQTVISEKYKIIRTALLLSASDTCHSILITSMVLTAGKTVTATNLAISLAQSQKRVLLVDADMRRPKIHKIFGLENKDGLSTYLAGTTDIAAQPAEESNYLKILPSGRIPENPSELLSSGRLKDMIEKLKSSYDFIIIDSPPMVDVTDAILVSKTTNQTVLVVRSEVSTYESVKQAERTFKSINVNVLGQIVNAVDEKKHSYYHYKYYGK
ncbi:MAG: hypothetical protein AVO38_03500 [delta proteobacterium ML8_D]|nr:MAG: hypothetical protein AVO38_03500 [delta proteobacterium ML8_D]